MCKQAALNILDKVNVTAPEGGVICAAVHLTPRAEREFRLEAERVGAYPLDRDEAERGSSAADFMAACEDVLEALGVQVGRVQA